MQPEVVKDYPHQVIADPEIAVPCPCCSAPVGETCHGFGYCPARSAAAGDSGTQPDPYIDAMAAGHRQEFEPVITYADCGYGIVPEDWHHGEGWLPVAVPGEGCER